MSPTTSIVSRVPLDILREIMIHVRAITPRPREIRMLAGMMRVNKHFFVSKYYFIACMTELRRVHLGRCL
jgi:hypothetical protein